MWFRKKKEEPQMPVQPPVCHHKYRDFNWYLTAEHNRDTDWYHVCIFEPYVCILCKHREDKLLFEISGFGRKRCSDVVDEMENNYPKLRPRAEIEDEINDMLMLDPYYLDAYYKLHPERKEQKQ